MFDETGRLKNGQHRLAAIMAAGVPVTMTVITGVQDDVTIYDVGSTRSTQQIASASGCGDIHKEEAAVGAAIVGRFDTVSKGLIVEWLKKNAADLARAYRICGAKNSGLSRRTSCVLATYLMLREEKVLSYEAELFYKVFYSGNTVGTDGYEPSPALVARRMFEARYKRTGGRLAQKEQTEILIKAMTDFHAHKTRAQNYAISEPMKCMEMVDKIRKEDGLA